MKKIHIKKAIDPIKSLLVTFPQVAAQWHPELNGDLTPDLVTAHSGKKVWWISTKDGGAYQAVIANKVRKYRTS